MSLLKTIKQNNQPASACDQLVSEVTVIVEVVAIEVMIILAAMVVNMGVEHK